MNTRVESAGYYARVTNSGNETIIDQPVYIYPVERLQFNVSSGIVTHTEGNVSVGVEKDRIVVIIGNLAPNQTLYFQIESIGIGNLPPFPSRSQIDGIYVGGRPSDTIWEDNIRIYARSPLASFSVASRFTHYYEGRYFYEYRTHTAELLYFLFLTFSLFAAGFPVSKLWVGRRYPFITLLLLSVNSFTYIFIGSGWEVNFLPSFAVLKQWLPITFIYHGSYSHISGNFVQFTLISLLMEIWLNVKRDIRTFAGWYLLPYAPNILMSILIFISASNFGFGLSYIVILLAISFWTYAIENWQTVVKKRIDILIILLGGIPITAFSGWLEVLILNGENYSAYYLSLATGHVIIGVLGIIFVALPYLHRLIKVILGRTKKLLQDC